MFLGHLSEDISTLDSVIIFYRIELHGTAFIFTYVEKLYIIYECEILGFREPVSLGLLYAGLTGVAMSELFQLMF